jgi:hypothetical protein
MACRELSGFNCRVANKPGVSKVHIFLFDVIDQYVYENDDLNYVSGYSATVLPTTYKPNADGSSYAGSKKSPDIDLFLHQLTLSFPKMESEKRAEFEKLRNLELTIIFEDENNVSWIMGQDYPVKLEEFSLQSGAKGGANDYTAVFQSLEPYQLREIASVSEGCFTSFSGVEQRRSVLTIANADALDFIEFSLAADDRIINYTATPALQPTLWNSNPTILADDTAQLLSLFEAGGTILNFALSYSAGGGGTVTIVVDSSDTSFGGLIVDDVIQAPSTIGIVLNLTTILSPEIANSGTIIQVSDSDGVLFSGGYGTAISGSGLAGTTNNAVIFVSFLYVETTTFTATVLDLPCSTVSYEYVFENTLVACALTVDFDFFKGKLLKIFVPYVIYSDVRMTGATCPAFQNISINILGYHFNMYQTKDTWHDSIAQFGADLAALIGQIAAPIDPDSLVLDSTGTGVNVSFRLTVSDMESELIYCNTIVRGFEQAYTNNKQFKQSRVLNLVTGAPFDSIVTHTDGLTNTISGTNLVDIIENDGFELENTPTTSNGSIDNIGVLWAFDSATDVYDEVSEIDTIAESSTCLTPTITSEFSKCYEGFTSDSEYNYVKATLDVSTGSTNFGRRLRFSFDIAAVSYILDATAPVEMSATDNTHFVTALFNSIPWLKLIHYNFNPVTFEYVFHLRVLSSVTLTAINELVHSRPFTLATATFIFSNGLTAKINPYCTLNWTLPTTLTSTATGANNLTEGHWQQEKTETVFATIAWVVLDDELTIDLVNDDQNLIFEVYPIVDYPQTGITPELSAAIASGSGLTKVIADVSTLLSGTFADYGFVAIKNQFGWTHIIAVDFTADFEVEIKEAIYTPIIWGTMDTIEYIGTLQTEDAPVFGSVVCV